jgi:hypothetical protein
MEPALRSIHRRADDYVPGCTGRTPTGMPACWVLLMVAPAVTPACREFAPVNTSTFEAGVTTRKRDPVIFFDGHVRLRWWSDI